MKRLTFILCSMMLSLAVSTQALAMNRGRERESRMRDQGYHQRAKAGAWYGRLNLTEEQKTKLRQLRLTYFREIKPLRDQLFSKRGELKLQWLQPSLDKAKILALTRESRKIQDQIVEKRTAYRLNVFNLLNPDQKEKVRSYFLAHRFGRHRGWRRGMMHYHGRKPWRHGHFRGYDRWRCG